MEAEERVEAVFVEIMRCVIRMTGEFDLQPETIIGILMRCVRDVQDGDILFEPDDVFLEDE